MLGFGFWGAVDFHQAGRIAEPLCLIEELVVTRLAALGLQDSTFWVGYWQRFPQTSLMTHALAAMLEGRADVI